MKAGDDPPSAHKPDAVDRTSADSFSCNGHVSHEEIVEASLYFSSLALP
jgi:hypothetical protein